MAKCRSSVKCIPIFLVCFNFYICLLSYNNAPSDPITITGHDSRGSIEQIIASVSPYAAAFAAVKQIFSFFGPSDPQIYAPDNMDSLIAQCENRYDPAFTYQGNILRPQEAAQLMNFYSRLSDYEKACAPFFIDYLGQFRIRSSEEIIKNFCEQAIQYLDNIYWGSPQRCLATLNSLEEQIYHSHKLRKKKIRPLGKIFKNKEYINDLIQDYRKTLRAQIEENNRQEELNRQEEEKKAIERVEHETIEQEQKTPMLDLQNIKEIIEWLLSLHTNDSFSKEPVAQLGFALIEACEHALKTNNTRYIVYKKRLQAVVATLQNDGLTEHKKYEITEALESEVSSWGMVLDRLKTGYGNALQHDIYQESIELLNQTADTKHTFFDIQQLTAMSDLVAESACAAHEYGQSCEYEQGYRVLDFASSLYEVLGETGKFLCLSAKGITKGCCRAGMFPFLLTKNLLTAPVETVSGIVGSISALASCLLQGIWESITLSGEAFAQSETAARIEKMSTCLNSMSYEEKIEEGAALLTELLFPAALSKIKIVAPRIKKFGGALRKVLKEEQKTVTALRMGKAEAVVQRAGAPVMEALAGGIGGEFVWNKIESTSKCLPGTRVPKTFRLTLQNSVLWVNANATEHMGEYLLRLGGETFSTKLRSQVLLKSFLCSVEHAMAGWNNLPPGRYFGRFGTWELGINTETGVIYHALMR